jgi:trimethylamine--corrinoid protein Co-methyltransferase
LSQRGSLGRYSKKGNSYLTQRDEPLALDLFRDFEQGAQFLTMPHTRKWYRKEHIFPSITDRETYDAWVVLGKKPMADRAAEEVARLLREKPGSLPDETVLRELEKVITREAKNAGLNDLPGR